MEARKSKHQEIYDFIKGEITSGAYHAGELLPTDVQIAENFNASRPTVAKALQRLVKEKALGRRAGYGTYVQEAKPVNSGSSLINLGLLIPALGETEIFEPICGQIAQLASTYQFNLVWGGTSSIESPLESAEKLADKYIQQKINGIFFAPLELYPEAEAVNKRIIAKFKRANIPVVLLDRDISSPPLKSEFDVISMNNLEAGFIMGTHLLEKKCRSIGFLTRPNIANTVHLRLLGLQEAVAQQSNNSKIKVFSVENTLEEFASSLAKRKDIDAIVAYNDAAGAELIMALDSFGINVPRDIKICAFDDVKYAKLLKVPLTTYRQPCIDLGISAVEIMISRIKNPTLAARKIILSGKLIQRESTLG